MIASPKDAAPDPEDNEPRLGPSALVVIDIGNTSITLGAWDQDQVHTARRAATDQQTAFSTELAA
ncbi:MAG: hypothetical protein IID40_02105, partial [Planctomycetes bacterium]|nr:hypothetical protein [Planctomycetota bacterium]